MSGTQVQTTPSFNTGNSAGDKILQLVSNPFQAQVQAQALGAALGTYIGLSILLAIFFSFVRPRHSLIYAPKTKHADAKHAPPPMGNGVLSWILPVTMAKENVLIEKIGMDAIVFLRFTRMLRNMFAVLALVGLCIMIPINVTQGNKSISGSASAFSVMTPLYVFGGGLWAQVIVAWATNIIVAYFLWHNYRRIRSLRRVYMESADYQMSLHARTVMVRDVASNLRNEDGILRITDEINPTGVTPRVTVGRNVRDLPDLIEEHEEHVRELESVLARYLKNPEKLPANRPVMKPKKKSSTASRDGNVDAIEYLTERIGELEAEIYHVRESVDIRNPMPYGFASWEHVAQAHTVAYSGRRKNPQGASVALAPAPNDLIWKNLGLSKSARKGKALQNAIWISILTVVWLPLNAAIAIFLSNLSNLGSVWPSFQRSLEAHKDWWSLVQGIAAPAITSGFYILLPIIFRRLQIRAGDFTKTEREQHVLRNLYTFFTLNNLVLFSIFSAIWQYVSAVINSNDSGADPWEAIKQGHFFLTITTALCQISPFWVTFILQRNLGAAIDLAQLWKVTVWWFQRTFMAPTPRQNIEWTAPPPFDYSSYYNYFLFYATIALCFSTLQPIILLVTAVYFGFDSILKKYLLMYVFITKTESGGQIWRTLFNRLIFALVLADIVIGVVVVSRDQWAMVGAMAPLLLLLAGFKWYCARTFDADIKYYSRSGMLDQERSAGDVKRPRADKIAAKFGHPALYKPLMTPMVHAKAQHMLADIYRGRLESEGDAAAVAGYSDIAMQPMTQGGKKPSASAPFEFVSEAQQNFTYYKNRDDFREEGGNLYGHPEDAMSLRSGTPMSFMDHRGQFHDVSPETSRANSPAPDRKQVPVIKRKEVGAGHVPPAIRQDGPVSRESSLTRTDTGPGDLSLRHGRYTDPNDDRANLLGDIRTPTGEFMSMDQWRPNSGTPRRDEGPGGSYDYFRGRR